MFCREKGGRFVIFFLFLQSNSRISTTATCSCNSVAFYPKFPSTFQFDNTPSLAFSVSFTTFCFKSVVSTTAWFQAIVFAAVATECAFWAKRFESSQKFQITNAIAWPESAYNACVKSKHKNVVVFLRLQRYFCCFRFLFYNQQQNPNHSP